MNSVEIKGSAQTEEIGELMKAMAAAQLEVETARKSSINPHYKSNYADLASVYAACRSQLAKQGVAVVQILSTGDRTVTCHTTLGHSSGQWMRGELELTPAKADIHGNGSAFTYARRYALAAMVGVAADEDDDGNAAVAKPLQQSNGRAQAQSFQEPSPKATETHEKAPAPEQGRQPRADFGSSSQQRAEMEKTLQSLIKRIRPIQDTDEKTGELTVNIKKTFDQAQAQIAEWVIQDPALCSIGADGKPSIKTSSDVQVQALISRYEELASGEVAF